MKINITVNVPEGMSIFKPLESAIEAVNVLRRKYPSMIKSDDTTINVMPSNFFNTSLETNVSDFIDSVSKELDDRMLVSKMMKSEDETNVHRNTVR